MSVVSAARRLLHRHIAELDLVPVDGGAIEDVLALGLGEGKLLVGLLHDLDGVESALLGLPAVVDTRSCQHLKLEKRCSDGAEGGETYSDQTSQPVPMNRAGKSPFLKAWA